MSVTDAVPAGKTPMLNVVAKDLQEKYRGTFGIETVQELVFDSYTRLAATATVDQWLVLGTEKFTDERLQAMVHAEDHSPKRLPGVLFLCVHNAGAHRWHWAGSDSLRAIERLLGREAPTRNPTSTMTSWPQWPR